MKVALTLYTLWIVYGTKNAINALSTCPQQCICSENNIVCSCDLAPSSELKISSLGGFYIKSLTVHSCSKVTVLNGSFSGVVLLDRLSFIHIGRLILEPNAFKGILQSPKQLTIEQSTIPILMSGSFTGLSHLEHIWIKQSAIHTISAFAFQYLSDVNYLYFRETHIRSIQQHAFSKMYDIRNIYFRGSVEIEDSESELFANSTVDELQFHEVSGLLNEGFLIGSNMQRTTISECTLKLVRRGEIYNVDGNRFYGISELDISNTTMNAFSPLLFSHFSPITISKSRIGKLRGSDVHYAHHYLSLLLEDTTIESVEAFSMSHSIIREITMIRCRVGNFSGSALLGSQIVQMSLLRTEVKAIQTTAFSETAIEELVIRDSSIGTVHLKAFERAILRQLTVERSTISRMEVLTFFRATIHHFELDNSIIHSENISDQGPFEGCEIATAHIHNSAFEGKHIRHFFKYFEPVRLRILNSSFECDPNDCEFNSMMLSPSRHQLLWQMEGNICRTKRNRTLHEFCKEPKIVEYDGVVCRRSWAISDCECIHPTVNLPTDIKTSVLIIGDCEQLIVNSSDTLDSQAVKLLYLYRIRKNDIVRINPNLQVLSIFHSNINMRSSSWRPGKVAVVSFQNSRLLEVEDGAMAHLSIVLWTMKDTYLSAMSDATLEETTIGTLAINGSRLESSGVLFRRSEHVHMENSLLFSSDGMTSVRSAHFANNTILCCCGSEECSRTTLKCGQIFPHTRCYQPGRTFPQTSSSILISIRIAYMVILTKLWYTAM